MAVASMEEAKQNTVLVHESLKTNCAAHVDTFRREEVESWLKKYDHVFTLKVEEPRVIVSSLEPRCIRVCYDDKQNRYIINASGQGVHSFKSQLMSVLKDKTATVEVITEDVGGCFDMKLVATTSENCMTIQAAKVLGCPVRWFNIRRESFMSDSAGRDNAKTVTIGLKKMELTPVIRNVRIV
jgi:CO/xanthine dehydrogenase Mo-binding subunit